jgi:hypothetical protein
MFFDIIGEITRVALIARGAGVRSRDKLRRKYGPGAWRKLKGIATVRLEDGSQHRAEIHWYEAQGIGKKEFKIKYLLD